MNRILLLDDNKDFVDATREALEFFDFDVMIGMDGDDALRVLENPADWPDIILADLNMPSVSGEDLLNIIQQHPELRHIKVIIMSGSSKERGRLLSNGADGFIEKPFKFNDLHSLIMEL